MDGYKIQLFMGLLLIMAGAYWGVSGRAYGKRTHGYKSSGLFIEGQMVRKTGFILLIIGVIILFAINFSAWLYPQTTVLIK